jgi:CDP-4-dehydro-6-deoxyglucose reductase
MFQYILKNNVPHKNINLIFGTRFKNDMCYADELYSLEKEHSTFHFYPTLSRENSSEWKGRNGYIHGIYKELYSDTHPAYFYICGWKNVIFEVRDNLTAMGYQRSDIKFELYDK